MSDSVDVSASQLALGLLRQSRRPGPRDSAGRGAAQPADPGAPARPFRSPREATCGGASSAGGSSAGGSCTGGSYGGGSSAGGSSVTGSSTGGSSAGGSSTRRLGGRLLGRRSGCGLARVVDRLRERRGNREEIVGRAEPRAGPARRRGAGSRRPDRRATSRQAHRVIAFGFETQFSFVHRMCRSIGTYRVVSTSGELGAQSRRPSRPRRLGIVSDGRFISQDLRRFSSSFGRRIRRRAACQLLARSCPATSSLVAAVASNAAKHPRRPVPMPAR